MPSADVDSYGVPAVSDFISFFYKSLDAAALIKPSASVEPALEETDLEDVLSRRPATTESNELQSTAGLRLRNSSIFASIETAARGILSNLIARVSIDSPDFVKVWNFFDIIQVLSDRGQCDPALLVWLIEELLDSQNIPGCRTIFDYLESRRTRIISKNFGEKKLVILRSCNELLRRLSRAEDTAFSGRVFIFLFQTLPPGDKSSVNLRGEYHTQNVTTYDQISVKAEDAEDKMDIDTQEGPVKEVKEQGQGKTAAFIEKKDVAKPLDPDALYPVFWSLQESFNQPKKLFETAHLTQFKSGLQTTMTAFKANPVQQETKSSKQSDDTKRGVKRKLDSTEDDVLATFNPKYLTSRDLFELEISDLTLRRYVLVQALIVMEFLLSFTPKAKEKLASISTINKSVAYLDQVFSEEDIKWATAMKSDITDYLKQATDGSFFFRMVETILSRDKNWVRWKIESCPPIERPAVSPQEWAKGMQEAKANTTNKRLRANAMTPFSLDFLKDADDDKAIEVLKNPERYELPDVESFKRGIQEADLEIEMPMTEQSKSDAIETKASQSWRALRIASRTKLAVFDKIDSYENISVLFEDEKRREEAEGKEVKENGGSGEKAEAEVATDDAKDEPSTSVEHSGVEAKAMVTDS